MARRNAFVVPEESKPYPLPSDEESWVVFKQRLNAQEDRKLTGAPLHRFEAVVGKTEQPKKGDTIDVPVDWAAFKLMRLKTYIVRWNFADGNGNDVPCTAQTIENLDPDVADELDALLDKHVEAMEEEKKVKSGSTATRATQTS